MTVRELIPIGKPDLGNEELQAVAKVMRSGKITSGEHVSNFEKEFAKYCGTRYAIATSNGTTALHASLLAAGIGHGDEVIVPDFSFIATATAVSMTGATPVFTDVEPDTFNIDVVKLKITDRTRAIIGVHLFGQPCDVVGIRNICDNYNLHFIEDAAQAHGAMFKNRKVGSFGNMACFSFYGSKNMTTGEGGMVTTNDEELNRRLRLVINHGQSQKYLHTALGYNYRMTDIAASIGEVQLKKLDGYNIRRRENAKVYSDTISVEGIDLPSERILNHHVYHQYVLKITKSCKVNRRAFQDYMQLNGIGTAVHYPMPIHFQPIYHDLSHPCPIASALSDIVVSIPVHPLVSAGDIRYICDTINEVV